MSEVTSEEKPNCTKLVAAVWSLSWRSFNPERKGSLLHLNLLRESPPLQPQLSNLLNSANSIETATSSQPYLIHPRGQTLLQLLNLAIGDLHRKQNCNPRSPHSPEPAPGCPPGEQFYAAIFHSSTIWKNASTSGQMNSKMHQRTTQTLTPGRTMMNSKMHWRLTQTVTPGRTKPMKLEALHRRPTKRTDRPSPSGLTSKMKQRNPKFQKPNSWDNQDYDTKLSSLEACHADWYAIPHLMGSFHEAEDLLRTRNPGCHHTQSMPAPPPVTQALNILIQDMGPIGTETPNSHPILSPIDSRKKNATPTSHHSSRSLLSPNKSQQTSKPGTLAQLPVAETTLPANRLLHQNGIRRVPSRTPPLDAQGSRGTSSPHDYEITAVRLTLGHQTCPLIIKMTDRGKMMDVNRRT